MGVRSRFGGGVVTAVVTLLPLLLSAALLAYLPKFVLGGLLLFFGSGPSSASGCSPRGGGCRDWTMR